jgi:hypothetical protein
MRTSLDSLLLIPVGFFKTFESAVSNALSVRFEHTVSSASFATEEHPKLRASTPETVIANNKVAIPKKT